MTLVSNAGLSVVSVDAGTHPPGQNVTESDVGRGESPGP